MTKRLLAIASSLVACGHAPASAAAPSAATAPPFQAIALPGVTGNATLDYIAYESGPKRVWVPVGETGSVAVLDTASGTFASVAGFATASREAHGKTRLMGPSAVAIGDGVAFVGNRASAEVCAVTLDTLAVRGCAKQPMAIDGVAYVPSAREVWVTNPRDATITVLDERLAKKAALKLAGAPEGYAVDDANGVFYTNLEDQNLTLAIDLKTHAVKATWKPACGEDGPRGIAVDGARQLVFVACTDHLQVLDAAHDGARLGSLPTGAGVDNIDYLPSKRALYAAAGKAGRLVIAQVGDGGTLTLLATIPTSPGARNPVVGADGTAYLADGPGARVLVVPPPR